MNDEWEPLNSDDDVVHFHQEAFENLPRTQIVFQLFKEIKKIWAEHFTSSGSRVFGEGFECCILIPGQQWRTGKIRVCLEFCPDETEIEDNRLDIKHENSPLDDLRQQLNEGKN
ncbi:MULTISPECIES: KGK domain-containing protein [unclassified Nostoc]|uniref:KGK domain-containing protein n=2 Tax=Nostoc TaxID=1177 RepID=UPI002AD2E309|nr:MULTISPECIES: KGK domain-containing protein [unclassified Nostoc]MDZ8031824.1 KGK domain-containing protein [Nostoc sp. DedSLP04]MDZ8129854.1 KGK domain-containing protein [Nostoc sp. DedQUE07]